MIAGLPWLHSRQANPEHEIGSVTNFGRMRFGVCASNVSSSPDNCSEQSISVMSKLLLTDFP